MSDVKGLNVAFNPQTVGKHWFKGRRGDDASSLTREVKSDRHVWGECGGSLVVKRL